MVERNVLYRIAFWFQLLYGNLKIRKFLVIRGSESFGAASFKKISFHTLRNFSRETLFGELRNFAWEIVVRKFTALLRKFLYYYLTNFQVSIFKITKPCLENYEFC